MTANRRIVLNFIATYGRSMYALVVGLFTARWVLMSLGQVDYGLFGVVGGLTAFVSFLNSIMAGAVSRFYAYSVGHATTEKNLSVGLTESRRWFSIAVAIHMSLPLVLLVAGYPIGEMVVQKYLTIPADRVVACVWVWRISCVSCFCSMINVPFMAMYNAKQEIAELTIYGFATTTFNALFLFFMVEHPGDWLVKYSAWCCLVAVVPQIIICCRAVMKYPECRFKFSYVRDCRRIKELVSFAGSTFFGAFTTLLVNQGTNLLVNKILGPVANAALALGNNVASHSMTLSNSLLGAMSPAITNAAGANDNSRMFTLAEATCKIGAALVLIFAVPISLEAEEVMIIWLENPPAGAALLCSVLVWVLVIDKIDSGLPLMLFANGRIFAYQITIGSVAFLVFLFAWLFLGIGCGVVAYALARACGKLPAIVIRLFFCKRQLGLSPARWIRSVLVPIVIVLVVSVPIAVVPRLIMSPSLMRVILSTVIFEMIYLPMAWVMLVNREQRDSIIKSLRKFTMRG